MGSGAQARFAPWATARALSRALAGADALGVLDSPDRPHSLAEGIAFHAPALAPDLRGGHLAVPDPAPEGRLGHTGPFEDCLFGHPLLVVVGRGTGRDR